MANDILGRAQELVPYLTEVRHHLHRNPELSMQEVQTTAFVKAELAKLGVEIVPIGAKVGVLGMIKGTKPGHPTVTALRADMDALPVEEKTGVPYASQNPGVMHACGHDGHTTVLLGVAKMLAALRDRFSGTVKLIFQPGEENLYGARSMVDAGVLENPPVDTIVALHGWPPVHLGKIGLCAGYYMASADEFKVKFTGSGGHGAYPHRCTDPIQAAVAAVQAINNIVSREIDAMDKAVISVCTIHGGTAFNIVPEDVAFSGTVRCHSKAVQKAIADKMARIVSGTADTFGCKYEFDYNYGIPGVVNDPQIIDLVAAAGTQILGENNVERLQPVMSSEDFSVYLEKVPQGAFFRLGITVPGKQELKVHNDRFDFNDDALPIGVAVLTQFVLNKNG